MTDKTRPRSPLVNAIIVIVLAMAAIAFFFLEGTARLLVSAAGLALVLVAAYLQRRSEP
ncbi:hypothetical protein [Terrabacter sp. NPDC000476]|uniref:hypothetical protein n=1 Tax=Terrabacter sp. NPDC000476 TaxID=3154258 RepID=UPI0033209562